MSRVVPKSARHPDVKRGSSSKEYCLAIVFVAISVMIDVATACGFLWRGLSVTSGKEEDGCDGTAVGPGFCISA
jgi:hypothetical protein